MDVTEGSSNVWTVEEVEYLRMMIGMGYTLSRIALMLGRSRSSVRGKIAALGLTSASD